MKKTFAFFFVFLAAALPAMAQSTCETRVDSHQDATTKQRVAYCLTPEKAAPLPPGPELVYYGVSSNKPQEQAPEETEPREPVYFDKDGVRVNQNFMDTKKFPAFANDTLSEQERLALEKLAKEDAAKAAQARRAQLEAAAAKKTGDAASVKTELETPSVLTEETKAGIAARKAKPKRFMKALPQEQAAQPETASAYSVNEYGVGSSADAAAYGQPTYGVPAANNYPYDPAAGYQPGNAYAPAGQGTNPSYTGDTYGYPAANPSQTYEVSGAQMPPNTVAGQTADYGLNSGTAPVDPAAGQVPNYGANPASAAPQQ